jgi:hypothetical protein
MKLPGFFPPSLMDKGIMAKRARCIMLNREACFGNNKVQTARRKTTASEEERRRVD